MPLKAVFQSMPWTGVILFVGAIGWKLGKMRLALTVMLFVFFIASSGRPGPVVVAVSYTHLTLPTNREV